MTFDITSEQVEGIMLAGDGESVDQVVNERPMISFFDGDSQTLAHLKKSGFNCTAATLGNLMRVPNTSRESQHLLQYAHSIPANFHEFDIAIVDLKSAVTNSYKELGQLSLKDVAGDATYALLSEYPQQVFNFKPFGVRALYSHMHEFQSKTSIFVVFADEKVEADYRIVKVSSSGNKVVEVVKCSNLEFYAGFPVSRNKEGTRLKENGEGLRLTDLLLKHMVGGRYSVVFEHPRSWSGAIRNYEPSEDFTPVAVNEVGEVVAFAHTVDKSLVLVFPQVNNKAEFLCELFNGHLAEFYPQLFPNSGAFGWLDDGSYPLPGELELRENRIQLDAKYRQDVDDNDKALIDLKSEHLFLREMLTESGEKLVCAIEIYLKWLGFDSVVNMDEVVDDTLEEDLQVDCGNKLLVVEVKGIGGTSTDKACSQISKIKFRRAEQRGKFDVFGLYIVNHQRYVSPKNRKNPPFTEHQINDARLDKRGLLTTYDLYRAYFLILGGILEKEFVREKLFDYGIVDFYPSNMVSVGRPKEVFKGGRVVVFDLANITLTAGVKLVAKKGDSYSVHEILTIQIDGVEVPSISSGEVGVMLNTPIPNRAEILLWGEPQPQVTQE